MAKILRLRRGNTAAHSTFTGKLAEVTVDTDKNTIVVHDNVTVGGHPLATESYVDTQVSDIIAGNINFGDIDIIDNTISTVNSNQNLILNPNGTGTTVINSELQVQDNIGIRVGENNQFSIRYRASDVNPYDRISLGTVANGNANVGLIVSSTTDSFMFFNPVTGNIGINTLNPVETFTVNGNIKGNHISAISDFEGGFRFIGLDVTGLTGLFHINSNVQHSLSLIHNGEEYFAADVNGWVRTGNILVTNDMVVADDALIQGVASIGVAPKFIFGGANLQYFGDQNSYLQFIAQNESNASGASTDIVATSDNGTDEQGYINLGINSSQYNNPDYSITGPNDGYLYVHGVPNIGGNLAIGTVHETDIIFHTGGTTAADEIARFAHGHGLTVYGNITPGANVTYDLGAPGAEWNSLYVSGNTIYIGGTPLSIDNTGNLIVNGNPVSGGGGTSLPYLELTNDPFVFEPYAGELVSFAKEDYATGNAATDFIDANMAITRGNNKGIYNPFLEADWDDDDNDGPSPAGTLWNKDGWTDLTNLDQRIYLSFYETFLRYGNNVLAAEAVMYHPSSGYYYKFDFTTWGNANQGAPVAYTRTRLDPVTGEAIGDPVEFSKPGYADPTVVNDPIDVNLTIARGNNQSIYNIALEPSYNSQGDGEDSPEGTEWNGDGWGNLRDVINRSYDTFANTLGRIGRNIVNKELIMHDMINDKYYAFKFSSWTQNGEGGGFVYTRQLINTSQFFRKEDYGDQVDIIIPDDGEGAGVGITRGENQGIYNPYREEEWDEDQSPAGTLWNVAGWDDLSDIESRTYTNFYDAYNGNLGNRVPGSKAVMYVPDNGKYYAIQWLNWTQGDEGGGFSYLRYEIDLTQLQQGVKFADGTVLTSAAGIGRVKSTASGGRRIEEAVGSNTVSVTAVNTVNITATASRSVVDDNRFWVSNSATDIAAIVDNTEDFDIQDQSSIQFSLDNSTWYTYTGGYSSTSTEIGVNCSGGPFTYNQGDTIYFRYDTGGGSVTWWNASDLPGGRSGFRGAVIDYHAYTGSGTIIGTIHIVDDNGDENISHVEVTSGSDGNEHDDLWIVQNEGEIKYRRTDGSARTLKIHWTAKVFYGDEYYD